MSCARHMLSTSSLREKPTTAKPPYYRLVLSWVKFGIGPYIGSTPQSLPLLRAGSGQQKGPDILFSCQTIGAFHGHTTTRRVIASLHYGQGRLVPMEYPTQGELSQP